MIFWWVSKQRRWQNELANQWKILSNGNGSVMGKSFRIRVRVDITRPLKRGISLKLGDHDKEDFVQI